MIANINYVKNTLRELKAKKKYGQNFLIDENIVDKIARISSDEEMRTIEIGPGLGALTEHLLMYSRQVDAYEIDKDMFKLLIDNIDDERLNVYLGDFLDVDLDVYEEKVNVCGNLPYYVTTPILFKLIESDLDINRMTIMVQKEVGERLSASVGSEEYSALSIEIQYLYEVKKEMDVSRKVFYPSPNVDSIVVSLRPIRERNREYEEKLFTLIKNCFRMRRKTLHNNLKDLYSAEDISRIYEELGLDENIRAQQLDIDTFIRISDILN